MKRILVCGGRGYNDQRKVFEVLDKALLAFKDVFIIQGGAIGADTAARRWAEDRSVQYEEYPADWERYGKRAGYIRNVLMLEAGQPDLVIAFPGGNGTKMMIDLAKKANVNVREIK